MTKFSDSTLFASHEILSPILCVPNNSLIARIAAVFNLANRIVADLHPAPSSRAFTLGDLHRAQNPARTHNTGVSDREQDTKVRICALSAFAYTAQHYTLHTRRRSIGRLGARIERNRVAELQGLVNHQYLHNNKIDKRYVISHLSRVSHLAGKCRIFIWKKRRAVRAH